MILTETVILKPNNYKNNIEYYKNLGYDMSGDISVKIEHLSKGSNINILCKCDYCENIKEISYRDYINSIKSGNKFACCIKCAQLKIKETNLIKYGIKHTMQLESIKQKIKQTIIKNYGVDHVSKIESIKKIKLEKFNLNKKDISQKIKTTWNNKNKEEINIINDKRKLSVNIKYGVNNISNLQEIKDKKEKTTTENYGGIGFSSQELNEKIQNTNIQKYGHKFPSKSQIIKDKMKKTNLKKFGVEYSSQNNEIKNKVKETNLIKYGVENIEFSEEFRKSNYMIAQDGNYIKYHGGKISEFKCDCGKDHSYIIDTDNYIKRKSRNDKICTICFPIDENVSIKEKELLSFIKEIYTGNIIENYRDKYEIDIYLPDLELGFEFNGMYWHSDKFLEKDHHINKLNHFKNKNIRIIYIWEDIWDNKKEIIKSQIRNWLNLNSHRIFARNCEIKEITDIKIIKQFLESNHIQGFAKSNKRIGLYYKEELVSIMTFDKFEGRKKLGDYEWNLSRFCNILNTNVIGGASKLLKYFLKNNKCNRIISYADKEWSSGNLYYKLGFSLINESKVSYKYFLKKRINKQKFTKYKLIKEGFDKNKSERLIMKERGFSRIYDCGQMKFQLLLK